jgi:hypothetical protein
MDNSEIIAACRLAFTGFEKNDRTELVRLLREDVVFDFSDSLPYGGRYVGKAEFLAFWKHVADKWQYFYYDAHDVLQDRDYVLVPVVTKALSPENYPHGERAHVPFQGARRSHHLRAPLCRHRPRARRAGRPRAATLSKDDRCLTTTTRSPIRRFSGAAASENGRGYFILPMFGTAEHR